MKAIVNTASGRLALQELPIPQPQAGQVLIRTGACGICGTDIKMIEGWDRTGFPSIPGHEWAGTVVAVGADVDAGLVDRRCVGENVLADGGEVGFEHPGGFSEFFLTEADKLNALPADFPMTQAALIEPLAVAVRGIRRLRVEDTSRALIFGDGAVGLLCLALLRRAGVEHIVMVGSRPARLALAEELGAKKTVVYHQVKEDLTLAIRKIDDAPFPNIVEASGSERALRAALESVTRCGHILLVGEQATRRADFVWDALRTQEWELIGTNASAGAWPEAVQLAISGELPLQRFTSHHFSAEAYAEAIELAHLHRGDVIKEVLEWQ